MTIKSLRFRVILTKRLGEREKYQVCLSKTIPAKIEDLELKCIGESQIGESKDGITDSYGSNTRSDLLYVDVNLEKEYDEGRLKKGDIL